MLAELRIWSHALLPCDCPDDPDIRGCTIGHGYVIDADGQRIAAGFETMDDALRWLDTMGRRVHFHGHQLVTDLS